MDPQYATPGPQYGQPAPAPQQYVQVPPPQQQPQPQYTVHPQQPQPQYAVHPQQPQAAYAQQPAQQSAQQPAQYASEAPMQRAVSAPVAMGGKWGSSLLDCSPIDTCLLSTFVPCILIGQTADRMRDPTMATAEMINTDCLVFTAIQCVTGCGWIHIMMKRSEIRQRFGIEGDGSSDCLATYCCPCCALIQQDKEVRVRTAGAVVPVTQGYQAPSGMQMPQGKN